MSNRIRPTLPILIGPTGNVIGPRRKYNAFTGQEFACCYGPCWEPGDDRYRVVTPHPDKPGHTLTRIYCGPGHQRQDAEEKSLQDYIQTVL